MKLGEDSFLAQDAIGYKPQDNAADIGREAAIRLPRKNTKNKRGPKSTTAPVIDPAAQAAAEAAAAAMAELLIAEEEDSKQSAPSK
jgi:hypothetical protein